MLRLNKYLLASAEQIKQFHISNWICKYCKIEFCIFFALPEIKITWQRYAINGWKVYNKTSVLGWAQGPPPPADLHLSCKVVNIYWKNTFLSRYGEVCARNWRQGFTSTSITPPPISSSARSITDYLYQGHYPSWYQQRWGFYQQWKPTHAHSIKPKKLLQSWMSCLVSWPGFWC